MRRKRHRRVSARRLVRSPERLAEYLQAVAARPKPAPKPEDGSPAGRAAALGWLLELHRLYAEGLNLLNAYAPASKLDPVLEKLVAAEKHLAGLPASLAALAGEGEKT